MDVPYTKKEPKSEMHPIKWIFFLILAALAAAAMYMLADSGILQNLLVMINEETPAAIFIPLMLLLPAFGFPISVFLILTGIKFTIAWGIVISFLAMPVHLTVAYALANKLLRPHVTKLLLDRDISMPKTDDKRLFWYAVVFTAIPGPPYALKNLILAISGLRFRYFMLIGCCVQGAMGIPFIILGEAMNQMNVVALAAATGLLLTVVILTTLVKRKYANHVDGRHV